MRQVKILKVIEDTSIEKEFFKLRKKKNQTMKMFSLD